MNDQLIETLNTALTEALANVHTAAIAKVTKVNGTTVNVKPVVNRVVKGQSIVLPEFIDVPPIFMRGGATYDAHPIAVGDYALLIFTERCFDQWYQGADDAPPSDYRMHDYSDGFALIGVSPLSGAIAIPTDAIKRMGDSDVEGDYDHEGNYVITGNVTINGNLTVNGQGGGGAVSMTDTTMTLTNGNVIADGIGLKTHKHTGVQTGAGNTGNPIA